MGRDPAMGLTAWFDFEPGVFPTNPFNAETPFGKPTILARGNTFEERDRLQERLEDYAQALAAMRPAVEGYIDRCDYTEGQKLLALLDATLAA